MSQPVPVFTGVVSDRGTLELDQAPMLKRYLRGLTGKSIELVIRRRRKQRSGRQNAYYHAVVVTILAEHFGYRPLEMHEALKFEFLRVNPDDQHPLATVRSTTSLTTVEMEDYLERIREWALTEHEVLIPLPNEVEAA